MTPNSRLWSVFLSAPPLTSRPLSATSIIASPLVFLLSWGSLASLPPTSLHPALQTGDAPTPFWTVTGGKAITHDDQLAGTGARTYCATDDIYFSALKHRMRIVDLVGANVDILLPHYAFATSSHPNHPHPALFHAKILGRRLHLHASWLGHGHARHYPGAG